MAKMGGTVLNVICLIQYRCFPNNTCTVSVCPNKATHSSNSRGGWLFVLPKKQTCKSPRYNAKQYERYCVIEKGGKGNVECEVVVGE